LRRLARDVRQHQFHCAAALPRSPPLGAPGGGAELKIGYIEQSGVDRVIVWTIYQVTGDKIAAATLIGQSTDPQTARFIAWLRAQPK